MENERKDMNEAFDESIRDKVRIRFITGSNAALFKDLIEENKKSLTGSSKGMLIEFLFERGEDFVDNE